MLFQKLSPRRAEISEYPKGTFLQTEKGFFFVHSETGRYRFITKRVLESWCPHRVVQTTEDNPAVQKLKVIAKMKFRNGSLLYSQADGKMYLIVDGQARHIVSPDILTALNMRRQDAVWVSEAEIKLHPEGAVLK